MSTSMYGIDGSADPAVFEAEDGPIEYVRVRSTDALTLMMEEVDKCNRYHGWHEEGRTFGDEIALLVTELGEAMDAFREQGMTETVRYESADGFAIFEKGSANDLAQRQAGRVGKPQGVPSEFADILIRLLDSCARKGVDLFEAFREKQDYNWTRPYKHGGKAL